MTEKNDKQLSFLPFHALNHFMREDYRRDVVRETVLGLSQLPAGFRNQIDRHVKRYVTVPGFRNSIKAPPALKARHLPDAFEKNADLVAAVLAAWAELRTDLRQQVFDLLSEREWEILPIDADRTKLPGFLTIWPKDEDFEVINTAFSEKYPDTRATVDDVSLMTVWISGRLPVDEPEDSDVSLENSDS